MFFKKKKEEKIIEKWDTVDPLTELDNKILDIVKKLIGSNAKEKCQRQNVIHFESNKYYVIINLKPFCIYERKNYYSKKTEEIEYFASSITIELRGLEISKIINDRPIIKICTIKIAHDNIYIDECNSLIEERCKKRLIEDKTEISNILSKIK